MVCPKCLHGKTHVYNSRSVVRTNQIWRRRRCLHCSYVFSTREYVEADDALRVTHIDRPPQAFSRVKLLLALAKALEYSGKEPDEAFYILSTVEQKLLSAARDGQIPVERITAACLEILQRYDTKAYLAYLAAYPPLRDDRDLRKFLKRKPTS